MIFTTIHNQILEKKNLISNLRKVKIPPGEKVKKIYFTENSYDTPPDNPRSIGDRLFLGSRWWFFLKLFCIVLRSRSCAMKGTYDDEMWARSSFDIFTLIEQTGGRFHLSGLDSIHQSAEPLIFVSNHMSTLETMVFPCLIAPHRKVTFVVKEELVKARVFGPIMRSRTPIVVGREDPRKDLETVFNEGPKLLDKGFSIIIFPQSTRHVEFNPDNFNSLGVKLARRTGVKVLPVAVKTNFWGNGKWVKDLGVIDRTKPIHMDFGTAMPVTGNGSEQHKQIIEFIQSHLDFWKKEPHS